MLQNTRKLLAIAVCLLTLAACGVATGSSVTGELHGGRMVDGKIVDGTIEYGHEQEPSCLLGGWLQQLYLMRQFLDSLVTVTADGRPAAWLATSWSSSPDGLTWTFNLKPGVRFTDGTPLDAAAVAYNFDYLLGPSGNPTASATLAEYYQSSRAVDATTVELHLKKPYQPLLSVLAQAYFGILSPTALKRGTAANCVQPVGSGGWIVDKWNRGQNIVFTRNDDYTSAPATARHQGPAYEKTLIWKFLKDPVLRYGSLGTRASDVVYDVPTVDWTQAQREYEVQRYLTPGRPVALTFNTSHGPFDDEKLRQAFAYSLDREASVESAFHDAYPYSGNGALNQTTPDYDPTFAETYSYQPQRADQLLDEAGWSTRDAEGYRVKDGKRLTVRVVYAAGSFFNPEAVTLLQDLQAQANAIGWDVQLLPATQSAYFAGEYSKPNAYEANAQYWASPTPGVMYIVWRQNLTDRPNWYNERFSTWSGCVGGQGIVITDC